jgi:hypothetical protein
MKNLKKAVRLIGLLLFLLVAASGVGIGSIFNTKERYEDKEIRIELVEKKDDEEEDDQDQVNPT